MTTDTRKQIDSWITWALRGLCAAAAWLVLEQVRDARAEAQEGRVETKELRTSVEQMRTEVVQRLVRVETKLEDRK